MIELLKKNEQVYGEFNSGEIYENKPIGFPGESSSSKAYSNLFYWAHASAKVDSTIGLHPHKGFEIMTFVLNGSIKHYDTLIDKWIELEKGDIQLIQSGSGISHSEFMKKDSSIFQIWFDPNLSKTMYQQPKYEDFKAKKFKTINHKKLFVGKNAPIKIESENVEIYELSLDDNYKIKLDKNFYYSIYLINGSACLNDIKLEANDFIKVQNETILDFQIEDSCCFFIISSPIETTYKTYI